MQVVLHLGLLLTLTGGLPAATCLTGSSSLGVGTTETPNDSQCPTQSFKSSFPVFTYSSLTSYGLIFKNAPFTNKRV